MSAQVSVFGNDGAGALDKGIHQIVGCLGYDNVSVCKIGQQILFGTDNLYSPCYNRFNAGALTLQQDLSDGFNLQQVCRTDKSDWNSRGQYGEFALLYKPILFCNVDALLEHFVG